LSQGRIAAAMIDLEDKKAFLHSEALLCHAMIKAADDDIVRRHLAFRIIVNTVSFEDLMGVRVHLRMRELRDALISQNSQHGPLESYDAADEICDSTVRSLIAYMCSHLSSAARLPSIPELTDSDVSARFQLQVGSILRWYHKMHVVRAPMAASILWSGRDQIDARTPESFATCLYRYNASKMLMTLGMYLNSGLNYDPACAAVRLYAKLDIVLHAVNMVDCVLENDGHTPASTQLHEIIRREKVGDVAPLNMLTMNSAYRARYNAARQVRSKICGHMDWATPLRDLLNEADTLELGDVYEMVREVDLAVHSAIGSLKPIPEKFSPNKTDPVAKPACAPAGRRSYYR
jgi:hypothetical protein